MSKTKQWAWDTAEKVSDDIINSYVKGDIDINKAKEKMSNVDNLDLVGIDEYNVDEVLIMAKEDYWKKANKEGRSA
mgnify:FL=1|jgi:hypothetical protein|tara:strand:+ start:302 stop:529 length:228 start_codon:yes stop_codon:yes gene_type:complete